MKESIIARQVSRQGRRGTSKTKAGTKSTPSKKRAISARGSKSAASSTSAKKSTAKQREANAKKRRQRSKGVQRYEFSVPFLGDLSFARESSNRNRAKAREKSSSSKAGRKRPASSESFFQRNIGANIGWKGVRWPNNPLPDIYENFKSAIGHLWNFLRWSGSGWHPSKIASLMALIAAVALIIWFHQADDFFIYQEDVAFRNLTYVDPDELYQSSQMEGWSVFWLNRDQIKEGITSHPYIADANISVSLPGQVSVQVTEQEPLALWVTDAGTLWLLEDGTALAARHGETQGLLEIYDGQAAARQVSYEPTVGINREVLDNARKLAGYFPDLRSVTFSSGVGLNFSAPGSNLWVYWGDGTSFETKFKNLLTIQNELSQGRIQGQLADLRVPEKPIVR